jgi:alkyldihydroxyacetonephosphate synthase
VIDLVAERLSGAVGAPHLSLEGKRAVARPGSAAEISDLLRIAREVSLPLGAGISSGVAVDLCRMHNVLHLDETSLLISAQAGIAAETLEQVLASRGLTLGPLPASSMTRTLGALLAAPRPSEACPRAGRFVTQCAGIDALLADGSEISTKVAPRKAVGPDMMHAIVGARGTTGFITEATIRVFRRGEARHQAAWKLPDLSATLRAARALLVRGGRPFDMWVTADPPSLSVLVDGTAPHAEAERLLADKIARANGGEPVPFAPAPLHKRAVYERTIALDRIAEAVVPPGARVAGWHTIGAALVDPGRAPDPEAPPAFFEALKAKLDPHKRFPSWSPDA